MNKVIELNPLPIERVEVPWEGKTILPSSTPFLTAARRRQFSLSRYGSDQECPVNPIDNPFTKRGMNVLVIDGPAREKASCARLRSPTITTKERLQPALTGSSPARRCDAEAIAVNGSAWAPSGASARLPTIRESRPAVTGAACYGGKRAIFQDQGRPVLNWSSFTCLASTTRRIR
jgi:hypothetical protein